MLCGSQGTARGAVALDSSLLGHLFLYLFIFDLRNKHWRAEILLNCIFGLEVFREEATAVYPPAHLLSGLSHNKWLLFFHSAWTLEFQWASSQGHCVLAFMILQTAISELSVCACPSYGSIASASWIKSIDSSQWELEHAVLVSPLFSRSGRCLSIFNGVCCCLAVLVLYRLLLPFPDLWHLYFS